MEQLIFQDLGLKNLLLNPSVEDLDEDRLNRQAQRMLELFMESRQRGHLVPNTTLMAIAHQYQARLYEVRRFLAPRGFCIDLVRRAEREINYYRMLPVEESTFYAQYKYDLI